MFSSTKPQLAGKNITTCKTAPVGACWVPPVCTCWCCFRFVCVFFFFFAGGDGGHSAAILKGIRMKRRCESGRGERAPAEPEFSRGLGRPRRQFVSDPLGARALAAQAVPHQPSEQLTSSTISTLFGSKLLAAFLDTLREIIPQKWHKLMWLSNMMLIICKLYVWIHITWEAYVTFNVYWNKWLLIAPHRCSLHGSQQMEAPLKIKTVSSGSCVNAWISSATGIARSHEKWGFLRASCSHTWSVGVWLP